jgi:flagellin-like hook-associated protein FlgL
MSDITLSAAVRSSLLSLQNTTDLVERTQGRLSTGLRVASAIDDPVAFFQAKTLNDRAFDFTEKKDGIDQGISTLAVALEGIESIESIVRQLKGVANSLKSSTGTQFTDLVTQYNALRTQIGELANDATYQGVNLIDNTSESLTVSFSDQTSSLLTVASTNVRESGLSVNSVAAATDTAFNYATNSAASFSAAGSLTVTYQGTGATLLADTAGAGILLSYGTAVVNIQATTQANVTITQGQILTLTIGTGRLATGNVDVTSGLLANFSATTAIAIGQAATQATAPTASVDAEQTKFIEEGKSSTVDAVITEIDSALSTLRSEAQDLGSNTALLQTRLDFTDNYVNVLETGAGKLTLADLNEEGANLLALQTRQQLGISALAFAGQAEQGILALFR